MFQIMKQPDYMSGGFYYIKAKIRGFPEGGNPDRCPTQLSLYHVESETEKHGKRTREVTTSVNLTLGKRADGAVQYVEDATLVSLIKEAIRTQTLDMLPQIIDRLIEIDAWIAPLAVRWWKYANKDKPKKKPAKKPGRLNSTDGLRAMFGG